MPVCVVKRMYEAVCAEQELLEMKDTAKTPMLAVPSGEYRAILRKIARGRKEDSDVGESIERSKWERESPVAQSSHSSGVGHEAMQETYSMNPDRLHDEKQRTMEGNVAVGTWGERVH